MKVSQKLMPGVMKEAYDRFIKTNKMRDDKHLRAGFFAGAAVAYASADGDKDAVAALAQMAMDAMEG